MDVVVMEEVEVQAALEALVARAVRFCYRAARSSRGAVGAVAEEVMAEQEQEVMEG